VKLGRNAILVGLLLSLPFDTIVPSNMVSFAHEQSVFFTQTNLQKKIKTYGLER